MEYQVYDTLKCHNIQCLYQGLGGDNIHRQLDDNGFHQLQLDEEYTGYVEGIHNSGVNGAYYVS